MNRLLVIRLFALVAGLLGLAYLIQAVVLLITFSPRWYGLFVFLIQLAAICYDVLIGGVSIFIAAGLFFRKEWARKAWLIFLIVTPLLHFFMTATQFAAGYTGLLYKWTGMVIFISLISWTYLSKATVKANFH